jgi:hypothetical protein
MAFLEGGDMGAARTPGVGQPALFERVHDLFHLSFLEENLGLALDITHIPACQHILRQRRLELALAPEHHDRMEHGFRQAQEFRECLDMAVILAERVLEAGLFAIKALRPLSVAFPAENPAGEVLGFDNEDAVGRDDDVVNLSGCAVTGGQRDIVEAAVHLGVQEELVGERALNFSQPTFEHGFEGHIIPPRGEGAAFSSRMLLRRTRSYFSFLLRFPAVIWCGEATEVATVESSVIVKRLPLAREDK